VSDSLKIGEVQYAN